MPDAIDQRLDRVESKIDKLTEVLVVIARNEEMLKNLKERLEGQDEDRKDLTKQIVHLRKRVEKNERTVSIVNGLTWITSSAVVIAIIRFFTTAGLT